MSSKDIEAVLARRLPAASADERAKLAKSYLAGVEVHAEARTTGTGPVPTTLSAERAELIAFVSRDLGRLLTEDEIAALLRVTTTIAKAVRRTMLAVHDDLPVLALKAAFSGAKRDKRGSAGAIEDGYRVSFGSDDKMEIARTELERQGYLWEAMESSGSLHVLLIDPSFPIDEAIPRGRQ